MQHCCLLYPPTEHIKGIYSLATRLYSWLLNPVGGEEHSREMMHITEVNLLLHSFLPDPEHLDRERTSEQQTAARKLHNFPVTVYLPFSFPEDK